MGNEQKKWVVTLTQLIIGLLIHGGLCLWAASAFVTKMQAEVETAKKERLEFKEGWQRHEAQLQRIDSEGSARYARESKEVKETLKEIYVLLREFQAGQANMREAQARILAELKKQ